AKAVERLDRFFHDDKGQWALTRSGPLHAELDNEPSIGTPWLYAFAGQPAKTQEAVRIVLNTLWQNRPEGIPGNDDLGEMSSWYVWSALGLYPAIPGRAELVIGSPLFPRAVIHRAGGDVTIEASGAATDAPFVHALTLNGQPHDSPWLPASFATNGGHLNFTLHATPDLLWGSDIAKAPPSFSPPKT
ncbi:MAG TPA: glycoside hydrolase domain-containing protein, partial [Dyella sp.]